MHGYPRVEWCHSNALSVLYANMQRGKNRNIFSWKLRTTMGYIFKVYSGSINSLAHYTAGRVDMLWVREAVFCFPVALVSNYSFHPFSLHSPCGAHCIFFTCCTILCKPQSWLWCHENPSKSAGCQTLRPAGGRQQSSSYPLGAQITTVRWRFQEGNNKLILRITFFLQLNEIGIYLRN